MKLRYLLITFLFTAGINANAYAISNNTWSNISDVGVFTLIGSALIVPTVQSDWEGLRQSSFSLGGAGLTASLGKALIHEQRPDKSDNKSFPSGHASMAFASATTLYRRYGWETGFPAYALATLTASARVGANLHFWHDVIAGAIIGSTSGYLFTDKYNDKVQLYPWLDSKGGGLAVSMQW